MVNHLKKALISVMAAPHHAISYHLCATWSMHPWHLTDRWVILLGWDSGGVKCCPRQHHHQQSDSFGPLRSLKSNKDVFCFCSEKRPRVPREGSSSGGRSWVRVEGSRVRVGGLGMGGEGVFHCDKLTTLARPNFTMWSQVVWTKKLTFSSSLRVSSFVSLDLKISFPLSSGLHNFCPLSFLQLFSCHCSFWQQFLCWLSLWLLCPSLLWRDFRRFWKSVEFFLSLLLFFHHLFLMMNSILSRNMATNLLTKELGWLWYLWKLFAECILFWSEQEPAGNVEGTLFHSWCFGGNHKKEQQTLKKQKIVGLECYKWRCCMHKLSNLHENTKCIHKYQQHEFWKGKHVAVTVPV